MEVRMRGTGWAIVTGASGGLGAAFTRALARRGHRVLAVGRSAESLARVADEVNKNGGFVETLAVDLAGAAGVAAVVARAHALGDIELLVNNALHSRRFRIGRRTLRPRPSCWRLEKGCRTSFATAAFA
jgi:short-subunit dehydrogenase